MYWRLASIPELRPLMPSERKRLWHASVRRWSGIRDLGLIILLLAGAFLELRVQEALDSMTGKKWDALVHVTLFLVFYGLYVQPLVVWRSRPILRRLIERGA